MAKFCPKCGSPLEEGSVFCTRCGTRYTEEAPMNRAPQAPVNQAPVNQVPVNQAPVNQMPVNQAPVNQAPAYQQQAYTPNTGYQQQPYAQDQRAGYQQQPYGAPTTTMTQPAKGKFPLKWVIIGGSGLLVVVILLIIIFSGGGAKGAFKTAFNASKNLNISKAADVSYEPNFSPYTTKKEYVDNAKSSLELYKSSYPEEYKEQEQKLKKAKYRDLVENKLTKDEIEEKKASLATSGYKDTEKIKDIRELKYTVVVDGETDQESCYAIKVGSKWYIYSFDSVF